MLEETYRLYRKKADVIDWKSYNCNNLFREYIKHENDDLRDNFFSALVCRYWGYAGRIYNQCNHHIQFDECHDCIIDALRYVLKNRVWENKDSSLYNDETGPDKAMHIAMKRQKGIMLSKKTAQRRLSNFNTLSIDAAHEDYNDSADGLLFNIESSESDDIKRLISDYFFMNEYLNGIMLDCICYNNLDVYDTQKIIKLIKCIKKEDFSYFKEMYNIDETKFTKCIKEIKILSNKMLSIKLKALLYRLKREVVYD